MAESEKMTFNINVVDLGQIDLLVEQGFYGNRTDFIRTAIRNQLNAHSAEVRQIATRRTMVMGVLEYSKAELEAEAAKGRKIDIKVIGMLILKKDVTPELAIMTINSLQVVGVFRAPDDVKRLYTK